MREVGDSGSVVERVRARTAELLLESGEFSRDEAASAVQLLDTVGLDVDDLLEALAAPAEAPIEDT
jgi:hypothetical protein